MSATANPALASPSRRTDCQSILPARTDCQSVLLPNRRYRRVTREGWYWLFAAVVLLGAGLFKGINLITLLGCLMLMVWILHWFSSARRIRRLRGTRSLEEPIFAGRPVSLEVEIHNPSRAAQIGLVLHDQGPDDTLRWPVARLKGESRQHFGQQIVFDRRGQFTMGPLAVSSSQPFGLLVRTHLLAPEQPITVLPRIGRIHRGKLRRRLAQAGLTIGRARQFPQRHPAAQEDLHGLRPFRSGDSPRWIHWRTTARKGELMVREFEEMPTENLILILDPGTSRQSAIGSRQSEPNVFPLPTAYCLLPPLLLEEAVSLAASLCWEWCRQTGDRFVLAIAAPRPVVLGGVTSRDFALRALQCLAVQPAVSSWHGEALLKSLSATELPPGPMLVVSAQPTDLADLLMDGLRRPVAAVTAANAEGNDFFERTSGHAR
jgi:uncharacterized protein (DUF58 family)